MRSLSVLAGLTLAVLAVPANAALAPQYYEEARQNAPHVVVLKTVRIETPLLPNAVGTCKVIGKVVAVERGSHYRVGGPVEVAVPCAGDRARVPVGALSYFDIKRLSKPHQARAWMSAPGQLALGQYRMLK